MNDDKAISAHRFAIQRLIKYMMIIGNHKNMTGAEKKQWVIQSIKEENLFNEHTSVMIDELIDYIILIDIGQLIIKPKMKKKRKWLSCFNLM